MDRSIIRYLTWTASLALIAGCSGGGSPSSPPAPTAKPTTAPTAKPTTTPTATPTPTAAPTATPTPIAGGATATLQLSSGLTAGAKSVVVAFPAAPLATATLPPGCQAAPPCSVTVPAQIGSSVSFRVSAYTSTNGTGTPIALATPAAAFFAAQNTIVPVALEGLMASYTLAFSPTTVVSQIATEVTIDVVPRDATGALIGTPFLTNTGQVPAFTLNAIDTSGATTFLGTGPGNPGDFVYAYSGILPNPSVVTSTISGYPNVSVPFPVSPATGVVGFATASESQFGDAPFEAFATGSSTLVRSYNFGDNFFGFGIFFDPSGTLWINSFSGIVGVKADGTLATSIHGLPPHQFASEFAADGTLYTVSGDSSQTQVNAYTLDSNNEATLVRSINAPPNNFDMAADASKDVYTAGNQNVFEFGPAGNGSVAPIASNSNASIPIALDPTGNFYARYCTASAGCSIGVWPRGTFGSNAPSRTIPIAGQTPGGGTLLQLSVDDKGNLYQLVGDSTYDNSVYFVASGTNAPKLLGSAVTTFAVPI